MSGYRRSASTFHDVASYLSMVRPSSVIGVIRGLGKPPVNSASSCDSFQFRSSLIAFLMRESGGTKV